MKIYDISQEVFGCEVYPGDPAPCREVLLQMAEGAEYNLTAFRMCAHNGTHVDAPAHFCEAGRTVDKMDLESVVGIAYVAQHQGMITGQDAIGIIERARQADRRSVKRILIKGGAVVSLEAAEVFAEANIMLLGDESQTVGPKEAPGQVHKKLLGAGIALLEGVRLGQVTEGVYFLCAAPINLGGADGAPCRAILIEMD